MRTLEEIGKAYGLTRQGVHQLERAHGIQRDDWRSPEAIFAILLERGIAGPLRKNLIDPARRDAIRQALATKP